MRTSKKTWYEILNERSVTRRWLARNKWLYPSKPKVSATTKTPNPPMTITHYFLDGGVACLPNEQRPGLMAHLAFDMMRDNRLSICECLPVKAVRLIADLDAVMTIAQVRAVVETIQCELVRTVKCPLEKCLCIVMQSSARKTHLIFPNLVLSQAACECVHDMLLPFLNKLKADHVADLHKIQDDWKKIWDCAPYKRGGSLRMIGSVKVAPKKRTGTGLDLLQPAVSARPTAFYWPIAVLDKEGLWQDKEYKEVLSQSWWATPVVDQQEPTWTAPQKAFDHVIEAFRACTCFVAAGEEKLTPLGTESPLIDALLNLTAKSAVNDIDHDLRERRDIPTAGKTSTSGTKSASANASKIRSNLTPLPTVTSPSTSAATDAVAEAFIAVVSCTTNGDPSHPHIVSLRNNLPVTIARYDQNGARGPAAPDRDFINIGIRPTKRPGVPMYCSRKGAVHRNNKTHYTLSYYRKTGWLALRHGCLHPECSGADGKSPKVTLQVANIRDSHDSTNRDPAKAALARLARLVLSPDEVKHLPKLALELDREHAYVYAPQASAPPIATSTSGKRNIKRSNPKSSSQLKRAHKRPRK